MTRPRTALLAAVAAAALLAGCGSGGDASQSDVQDEVEDLLVAQDGFIDPELPGHQELSPEEAADVAACVSRDMFESPDFTKEERNEIASASDSQPPDDELVAKTVALVEGCVADPSGESQTVGPEAPADE